ncbi:MAG: DUF4954 family protein [Planctomycetes bacterium]|nr:DUF4954 family protein [Planctomycetota bacterium]
MAETYRKLDAGEIEALKARNCHAYEWDRILVKDPFDANRLYSVFFHGDCRIGRLDGSVTAEGGRVRRAGIYRATIDNVETGDNVLINQVNGYIANYAVGAGAIIQGVGVLEADPEATFGVGAELESVNEGGGRDMPVYPTLTAQVAHIMALHRYKPGVVDALRKMVEAEVAAAKAAKASVGECAIVRNVPHIKNVRIGAAARVIGAAYMENGTVLSEAEAPVLIGSGVVLKDFMVGEGSSITDGAILEHCFVGQGCKVGKQYSGENSLFFANSEAFHGEGCSIFGGPYTVTHHKATLMIAGLFSFYNAGSGSNQSNHMYKLGPIHQGVLERGSKTGSFSYMLWPCRLGPFSVVIGKHMDNFDIGDLPFSYVTAAGERSYVVPGMNMFTVGTVRDGAKWPARDRRKGSVKRDLIVFDVFSPYTVGRMIAGEEICGKLYEETPKEVEDVTVGGALVRRRLLRTGKKTYSTGIESYLLEKVFERAEKALEKAAGAADVQAAMKPSAGAVYDPDWVDISGLLAARSRMDGVEQAIGEGKLKSLDEVNAALKGVYDSYGADEWAWVCRTYGTRYGKTPDALGADELKDVADAWLKAKQKFVKAILADAEKEFSEVSRIGFGADGPPEAREADFQEVRGTYGKDKFVKQLQGELETIEKRAADFRAAMDKLG